jgi:exodeoxyribonuclease VII small subunit
MSNINELSFEQAYTELETIVNQLAEGEVSLEETLTLYERGRELSAYCQRLLDTAQLKVSKLDPQA